MNAASRGRYLFKNTVIFALGNFGTKFISFFLVPLYTNVLSTSQYGIVDMISTIGMVLVPLLTLNISESVMRFSIDQDADHDKILSIGISALAISAVVGTLIIPVSRYFDVVGEYAPFIYLYTLSLSASQMLTAYLRGKELLLRYSIGNILQTFLIAVLNILFLVHLHWTLAGYLLAYIIANFATAAYAFAASNALNACKSFAIDKRLCTKMLTYSVVLIPNSFMWWIMNSSDRIMVTAMIGSAANGIYAIAYKIPTILSTMTQVFNQAWSYSAIHEEGSDDEERFNNVIYNRLVTVVSICAAGLLMIMKIFLQYYVAAEYYEAWRYTAILMIGVVFSTLGSFAGVSYTVHKDSMGFLISGASGAIINILLNFLMIPYWGAMGAAIATAISYIVVFVYRMYDTRRYLTLRIFKGRHVVGYIVLCVQACTTFWDTNAGQFMLVAEFLIMVVIHRKGLKEFATDVFRIFFMRTRLK